MFPEEGYKPRVMADICSPKAMVSSKIDSCTFKGRVDYLVTIEFVVSSCTVLSVIPPQNQTIKLPHHHKQQHKDISSSNHMYIGHEQPGNWLLISDEWRLVSMLTKQLRLNICQCVREKHRKELESENMDSSCEAASNSRASKDKTCSEKMLPLQY